MIETEAKYTGYTHSWYADGTMHVIPGRWLLDGDLKEFPDQPLSRFDDQTHSPLAIPPACYRIRPCSNPEFPRGKRIPILKASIELEAHRDSTLESLEAVCEGPIGCMAAKAECEELQVCMICQDGEPKFLMNKCHHKGLCHSCTKIITVGHILCDGLPVLVSAREDLGACSAPKCCVVLIDVFLEDIQCSGC